MIRQSETINLKRIKRMGKETKKKVLFWGLDWVDLALAAVLIALVALAVNLLYPPYGWGIGIAAALLLLYLAKRRRDQNTKAPHEKE